MGDLMLAADGPEAHIRDAQEGSEPMKGYRPDERVHRAARGNDLGGAAHRPSRPPRGTTSFRRSRGCDGSAGKWRSRHELNETNLKRVRDLRDGHQPEAALDTLELTLQSEVPMRANCQFLVTPAADEA